MTVNRQGLRTIVVDGRRYAWSVRQAGCPCCHGRSVVIVDASRRGSVVLLPGPVEGYPAVPITPQLIADRIREARGRGWQPGEGSGIFAHLPGAPA